MKKLIGFLVFLLFVSTFMDIFITFYYSPDLSLEGNPLIIIFRRYSVSFAWFIMFVKDTFLILIPWLLLSLTNNIYGEKIKELNIFFQFIIWVWIFSPAVLVIQQHAVGVLSWIFYP